MKVLLVLAVALVAGASAKKCREAIWDDFFRLNLNPDANKFVGLHDIPRPFTSSNDPVSSDSEEGRRWITKNTAYSVDNSASDSEEGRRWITKNTAYSVDNSASDSEEGRRWITKNNGRGRSIGTSVSDSSEEGRRWITKNTAYSVDNSASDSEEGRATISENEGRKYWGLKRGLNIKHHGDAVDNSASDSEEGRWVDPKYIEFRSNYRAEYPGYGHGPYRSLESESESQELSGTNMMDGAHERFDYLA